MAKKPVYEEINVDAELAAIAAVTGTGTVVTDAEISAVTSDPVSAGVYDGGDAPLVDVDDAAAMSAAAARAEAARRAADGDTIDTNPLIGDGLIKVSYHPATRQFVQYNPAHEGRNDFQVRSVKQSELPRLNLAA